MPKTDNPVLRKGVSCPACRDGKIPDDPKLRRNLCMVHIAVLERLENRKKDNIQFRMG